jgi:hypothetical protein
MWLYLAVTNGDKVGWADLGSASCSYRLNFSFVLIWYRTTVVNLEHFTYNKRFWILIYFFLKDWPVVHWSLHKIFNCCPFLNWNKKNVLDSKPIFHIFDYHFSTEKFATHIPFKSEMCNALQNSKEKNWRNFAPPHVVGGGSKNTFVTSE